VRAVNRNPGSKIPNKPCHQNGNLENDENDGAGNGGDSIVSFSLSTFDFPLDRFTFLFGSAFLGQLSAPKTVGWVEARDPRAFRSTSAAWVSSLDPPYGY